MLVVTTIRLSKGFQAWKDMVHSVGDKLEEHGMTFVFAGMQKTMIACYILSFTLNQKNI